MDPQHWARKLSTKFGFDRSSDVTANKTDSDCILLTISTSLADNHRPKGQVSFAHVCKNSRPNNSLAEGIWKQRFLYSPLCTDIIFTQYDRVQTREYWRREVELEMFTSDEPWEALWLVEQHSYHPYASPFVTGNSSVTWNPTPRGLCLEVVDRRDQRLDSFHSFITSFSSISYFETSSKYYLLLLECFLPLFYHSSSGRGIIFECSNSPAH